MHYGTPRHSGRYPWGSGENPYQSEPDFLGYVAKLRKEGLSEKEIAESMNMNTAQLRAQKTIARNAKIGADMAEAHRLKEKGYSNIAIGERLGVSEGTVRNYLKESTQQKQQILTATSDMLKDCVDRNKYVDIGVGTEHYLGISRTKLKSAVAKLKEEGYTVHYLNVEQLGTGNKTSVMVLAPPGTEWKEVNANKDKIRIAGAGEYYTEDGGRSWSGIEKPVSIDSNRIDIAYESGKDGVIELRRGAEDLSLGNARYAQVRIAVDDTHYLKGMAMYSDDLPPGVDIRYNTNKSSDVPKMDVLKKMKDDPDNPFGATIKTEDSLILAQRYYTGKDGKKHLSPLNIVNEEGNWGKWSKSISSQVLSKQDPVFAKKQLDLAYDIKKNEFDEINALTNSAVKKKLMQSFSDDCDSSAVTLKAAALPRQGSYVILPFEDMKPTEIYAPKFRNGEKVVLIRHPHGGIFEIPELTVNNKHPGANRLISNAIDAVGINPKVAGILSGADFDGDSVLVIPNNSGDIKRSSPLEGLKNFDPQRAYPGYPGMSKMTNTIKQQEMGKVSNLITDMTIKGATPDEIARAVRHSMVVIDAEKHGLNYKQSFIDNNIAELKRIYQGGSNAGASTLVSRASSEARVPARVDYAEIFDPKTGKTKRMSIDPVTGKKLYTETGETYKKAIRDEDGKIIGVSDKELPKQIKSTRMAEVDDAYDLSSGTRIENIYAAHANSLKKLANQARLVILDTPDQKYNPSSREVYKEEVEGLKKKLTQAERNAPLERKAQLLANAIVKEKMRANPNLDQDDIKKLRGQTLNEARRRVGAKKELIDITQREWDAIQAGAVSNNTLMKILDNTDLDKIKEYATPRNYPVLTEAKLNRARMLMNNGKTYSEISEALGVSVSTVARALTNQ